MAQPSFLHREVRIGRPKRTSLIAMAAISLMASACAGSSVSSITTLPSATAPTTQVESTTTTVEPLDPFHVVRNQIIDPNGQLFYPVGANVAISTTDYPYVFEGGNGGVNGHVEDVQAWNWNTVRANLKCFSDSGGPTTEQVVAGIDQTVKELTAARIVVILECHDGTGFDVVLDSDVENKIGAFWDLVVERYNDNPYVWFNFFNEPFESDDLTGWKSLNDFYINRYRAKSDNIFVVDLPLYGQGLNLFDQAPLPESLAAACNVIFGWHAYGSLGDERLSATDYKALIESVQRQGVAVIASEVGYIDASAEETTRINDDRKDAFEIMTQVAPETGVGLLWWHAIGDTAEDSLFRLKQDGSGFWTAGNSGNLTEAGDVFWEFSQKEHEIDEFKGTLPSEGCESPEAGPGAPDDLEEDLE